MEGDITSTSEGVGAVELRLEEGVGGDGVGWEILFWPTIFVPSLNPAQI